MTEVPEEQAQAPSPPIRPPAEPFTWATGRRKSAVARVRIRRGTGVIQANRRKLSEYFPLEKTQKTVMAPLRATRTLNRYDVYANLNGGGLPAQAGAMMLGIARALVKIDSSTAPALREARFLTRDPREKERKKPGKKGARASFQFSKR